MKRRIISAVLSVLIILSLLTTAAGAAGNRNTVYTNIRQIANNLQYINKVSWSSAAGRGESFTLRLTGLGDAYPIVMGDGTVYGALTMSNMVNYAESLGKNVLAAVNTDFFSMQTGVPIGIVIEDGVYKSSPGGKSSVSFDYNGEVRFSGAPSVKITLYNNGGIEPVNTGNSVSLTNFNKHRADTGGLYLFSESFSEVSTRTATDGWFVRFRILEGIPSVSGTMTLEVTDKLMSNGELQIGEGYLILTAATESGYIETYDKFAVGDIVTLTTECSDENLINAKYATGGGDMLISNGVKTDAAGWEQTLLPAAPRTAFGVTADGTVISYVIDGRNAEHSMGVTLSELADELLKLGCVNAVNFDGGGSSALSVRLPGEAECKLVSRPSEGKERACSTYILFVTDAVPDGMAKNLAIRNDGIIVLTGSSVELEFAASDKGYKPVPVPGDVTAVSSLGGIVDGAVYTAGQTAGTDVLSLLSASAAGTGNIFVINEPTSVTAVRKDTGEKLTSLKLMPGETLELGVLATYYRRSVVAQEHSFTYELTEGLGVISEDGVFTASNTSALNGIITVSAGSTKTEVQVEIGGFTDMTGHWAKEFVDYLAANGIVKGISQTEYGPELEIRRADFILMLYRAAGEQEIAGNDGFDDVDMGQYYAKAVLWAKANGIAEGTGNGKFEPLSPLTRQQAFTFVYRALDILDVSYEDGMAESLDVFEDFEYVAQYAVTPAATLIKLGVVEGAYGLIMPENKLTRAQMAKVLSVLLFLKEK